MTEGDARPGVGEVVLELLGVEERVHHREDRADPQDGEPGLGELEAVREHDQDALARLHPEGPQRRRATRDALLKLGVGPGLFSRDEADLAPAALVEVPLEVVVVEVEPLQRGEVTDLLGAQFPLLSRGSRLRAGRGRCRRRSSAHDDP